MKRLLNRRASTTTIAVGFVLALVVVAALVAALAGHSSKQATSSPTTVVTTTAPPLNKTACATSLKAAEAYMRLHTLSDYENQLDLHNGSPFTQLNNDVLSECSASVVAAFTTGPLQKWEHPATSSTSVTTTTVLTTTTSPAGEATKGTIIKSGDNTVIVPPSPVGQNTAAENSPVPPTYPSK